MTRRSLQREQPATWALLRLLTGRLGADHTPAGVTVTGPLDLAGLRAVFAGF